MHHLPPVSHPTREFFDVATDLVPIGTGERQAPLMREAVSSAKRTIAANPAIRAIHAICMAGNDDIVLVRIGARGGVKRLWNFSKR